MRPPPQTTGGQPLDPYRRVGARWVGLEVVANARLKVPVWIERAAVERLHLALFERLAERAFALALQRKAIDVAPDPGLAIPAIAVATLASLIFGEIEEDLIDGHPAMLAAQIVLARAGHGVSAPEAIGEVVPGRGGSGLVAGRKVGSDLGGGLIAGIAMPASCSCRGRHVGPGPHLSMLPCPA